MKNAKKYIKLLVMACILVFLFPVQARAEEEEEEESRGERIQRQIVKIVAAYEDESGTVYYAKQGSGFVLGITNGTSGQVEKYIVSDYGIVEGDNKAIEAIKRKYGLEADEKLSPCFFAVGDMGVTTKLEVFSYSNETRYVVLKPSLALADKQCVKLGDGGGIVKNARIFVEGYGGARSIVTDLSVEDRKINQFDTVITEISTEAYFNDEITYFYVGEIIDEGMAGAPIFDENDCVVGMFILNNGNMRAMSVANIRIILDSLDIKYLVTEDDATYDVPTQAQKEQLKSLITDNKEYISGIKKNLYTSKSWNTLYTSISKADEVYINSASTAKQFDDSIADLQKARKKMKTKVRKWIFFNIIAGVVVCLFLFLLIKKLIKRSKIQAQRRNIA